MVWIGITAFAISTINLVISFPLYSRFISEQKQSQKITIAFFLTMILMYGWWIIDLWKYKEIGEDAQVDIRLLMFIMALNLLGAVILLMQAIRMHNKYRNDAENP